MEEGCSSFVLFSRGLSDPGGSFRELEGMMLYLSFLINDLRSTPKPGSGSRDGMENSSDPIQDCIAIT
jgi:hypothetical protein